MKSLANLPAGQQFPPLAVRHGQNQRRFPFRPVAAPSQRRPHGPLPLGVDRPAVARAALDHAIQHPIPGILEEILDSGG
jgi:hypothetical protein